ncbi:nuclear transport factor 2 family protein [Paraglaciecola aquimarina]|uniref:Nuclear transport factor 2 family protein n=1 Tax=Paraglaciecola algarum TaxID=3050085 RepID=A0ABS9D853_9ALTE|nr:nuclear transport factor 2 family protein [Paraglaciecola sp. G1-23]MCF2949143.1 nuclear transport factor 2 family protein [Paraglaciecola sp. G1-23]
MKLKSLLIAYLIFSFQLTASADPVQEVNETLDNFHQAASEANLNEYFALLTEHAVFIGTDASERWSKEQFYQYAKPYFEQGKGWSYTPDNRHIYFSKDKQTAWFDELVTNKTFCDCRGTGILELTSAGWKISQYHLTIPIPNELADDIVKKIKVADSKR